MPRPAIPRRRPAPRRPRTHQQLDRELLGLEGERRKLLAAYYADAIDLRLLRQEQTRISQRTTTLEARRRSLTANLDQWQVILDTADDLQREAANALLKTLEEPPGSVLLILLATDVDELTKVLGELLDSPLELRRLGANGRQRALDVFSWESVAAQTVAVYEQARTRVGQC